MHTLLGATLPKLIDLAMTKSGLLPFLRFAKGRVMVINEMRQWVGRFLWIRVRLSPVAATDLTSSSNKQDSLTTEKCHTFPHGFWH